MCVFLFSKQVLTCLWFIKCTESRVRKTWCPLIRDKLFCPWDKCEFVFTYKFKGQVNTVGHYAHFSGQAINHGCSFSSFQLSQRTTRVKSGTRKTEDSLAHWTSASQFFFLPYENTDHLEHFPYLVHTQVTMSVGNISAGFVRKWIQHTVVGVHWW